MIGRLRGVIADRLPDGSCILDVNGVGYEVFVPLGTLGRLADDETLTLHVHTHVREDQLTLFGFARTEDRRAFRTLLGISGVGPKLALSILGSMSARELASAIASQDKTRFKGIPGVGKRTTERLLLELRDKLSFVMSSAPLTSSGQAKKNGSASIAGAEPLAQVAALLISMGFKPVQAERAVAAIADESEGLGVEALLKKALGQLG